MVRSPKRGNCFFASDVLLNCTRQFLAWLLGSQKYKVSWWLLNSPAISLHSLARQPFNACRRMPCPFFEVPNFTLVGSESQEKAPAIKGLRYETAGTPSLLQSRLLRPSGLARWNSASLASLPGAVDSTTPGSLLRETEFHLASWNVGVALALGWPGPRLAGHQPLRRCLRTFRS